MASFHGNPLLEDFEFPPYDRINALHVRPGIRELLEKLDDDLEELETNVEPNWPKLVEPLEKIVDRWAMGWGMVNHLMAVKGSSELRSAIEDVQPENDNFGLMLRQSKPIYNAFMAIRESPDWHTLSDARKRIVEYYIKDMALLGILLEDDKRDRFDEVQQELERLQQIYEENVSDAINNFAILITDKQELDGLPVTTLNVAAQIAVLRGHEYATAENGPWEITLDTQTFCSVMQHARNRSLREEISRAYVTVSGNVDNIAIIEEIMKLRLEKAKLLGYNNYAEISMEYKMSTVEKAEEFLEKLRCASWNAAVQDIEDLKKLCKKQGAAEADDLRYWDIIFWSSRLGKSKYGFYMEELRPYFSLPNVMEGLFSLSKTLFGIEIEAADGLAPVWDRDVRFYCVKDSSGSPIAYFYFDPYSRPAEKMGGAWMDGMISRSRLLSNNGTSSRLPVANIVCNLAPPLGNKPSLMTFYEVRVVFHEFGHALQHMLTKQDEGLVSGTRGIEPDVAEMSSQFMENWCYHRDTFMSIAKHYETGESLSEDVYLKLLAARSFCTGSSTLRVVKLAKLYLGLHTKYIPGGSQSIYDFDLMVSEKTQVIPPQPEYWFLSDYGQIISGGYAAWFYSNKWAEMLAADAFSAFEDAGLDDIKALEETGHRFRETILAHGGGKAPLEVFVEFRGREPSLEPLLRHNGLP